MANASDNSPFGGLAGKIFLIGFMGTGKTYWGKKWSQKYYLDFYDLDEVIEEQEGKTISTMFEEDGEDHFRKIEATALRIFSEKDNCIVACGGGAACFNDNMAWMNENGTTIYLAATAKYIYDRVIKEKEKRPLISKLNQAALLSFIEQKLKEREPYYKQAKIVLPVEELSDNFVPGFLISNS